MKNETLEIEGGAITNVRVSIDEDGDLRMNFNKGTFYIEKKFIEDFLFFVESHLIDSELSND